jgi:cephalosporin-C deacetylase-like acetyl esterase
MNYFIVSIREFFAIPFILTLFISPNCYGQAGDPELNKIVEPKAFAITYIKPSVFDSPELIRGLEITDFQGRRCIGLKQGSKSGLAEDYFYEPSGRYNITISYFSEKGGNPGVKLMINGEPVGSMVLRAKVPGNRRSNALDQKTFSGINIRKWSKISLNFFGNGNAGCRIAKILFTPAGVIEGESAELTKPTTLELFESSRDRLKGREMLAGFVNRHVDSLMESRVAALRLLKTPEDWQEQQNTTRRRLEDFFGKFPERTPLNPKITGKIEHEKYSIEKIYFESQPGYYVTANLYIPKNRSFPLPAVLFTCGHSDVGKASPLYQEACIGLATKGYIVLSFDPTGEGERIEYFNKLTKHQTIEGPVSQHYYLGRPSFLLNRTLSGLRTWDAIRALDYLVSRPEVDTTRIAAVGNSGGGQMALLITAVDQRIKICAAGHPGGQMEKNYLPGQNLIDRQILSLIAPRPVRVIVGNKSGGEVFHRKKIEDIQLFDEGLGYDTDRAQICVVDGVHDLKYPKRAAVYQWLNKWFHKEEEGSLEIPMQTEEPGTLWATRSGFTLLSPGGVSGQTLNAGRLKNENRPAANPEILKERIASRIGLHLNENKPELNTQETETVRYGDLSIEKLAYQSEEGILIPSLLIKPRNIRPGSPVYIYASDQGKPRSYQDSLTPFALARKGFVVLAIDVRGIGETSPTPALALPVKYSTCTQFQWLHDCLAIQSPGFGRTMLAMRTHDLIRGMDFVESRPDLQGKKIVLYGEGLGGLWATLASIYDSRATGVITENTLCSYKQLINHQYYAVSSDYFWVPGALCDFDIPNLVRLASSKPQVWVNPINGLGQRMTIADATTVIGINKNVHFISSKNHSTTDISGFFQPQ